MLAIIPRIAKAFVLIGRKIVWNFTRSKNYLSLYKFPKFSLMTSMQIHLMNSIT